MLTNSNLVFGWIKSLSWIQFFLHDPGLFLLVEWFREDFQTRGFEYKSIYKKLK